jgi:hypothetical protein
LPGVALFGGEFSLGEPLTTLQQRHIYDGMYIDRLASKIA